MSRRKNPSSLTWLLLIGGGGLALYLVTRRKDAVAAGPAVQEEPAADGAPASDGAPAPEETAATCYEAKPIGEPGYNWRCVYDRASKAYRWHKVPIGRAPKIRGPVRRV